MANVKNSLLEGNGYIIGVDVAKILAMFLVVVVHVNYYGLPFAGVGGQPVAYRLARSFVAALAASCIDIFAIASGYVGITSSFRISRLIKLWLQVVATGLAVLGGVCCFTDVAVRSGDWLKACIPIAKKQYWYMTAYFMLSFTMPVLNAGIKALDKTRFRYMLLLMIGVICGESLICSIGALGVDGGYSFEWLLVLYALGAYIRLYVPIRMRGGMLLAISLLCACSAGWCPIAINKAFAIFGGCECPRTTAFKEYTSPLVLATALFLFLACIRLHISSRNAMRMVKLLSATSLGVYLIHVQPLLFAKIFIPQVHSIVVRGGGWGIFIS